MTSTLIAALALALTASPTVDDWVDAGWELKNTLPTQAIPEAPEPPPEPATPTEPTWQPPDAWRPDIAVYDGWNPDRMVRILACESGGNPYASSHTDDHGLLQIHWPIWGPHFGVTRTQLYDPATNIDLAWQIWTIQGYGAWVCNRLIS